MDLGLGNRVVLVSGAGQGVGRAIGLAFADEGAAVAFHYHGSAAGAQQAVAEVVGRGGVAGAYQADIRDAAAVDSLVASVEADLGPIDVLVNNAAFTARQDFLESTPDDWLPQIDVTVLGTMRVCHVVLKRMSARGRGAVVTLTGDSGRVGESKLSVTAAARAAAIGFSKSLAREMARFGIRVNVVSLGLVETPSFARHVGSDPQSLERIKRLYPLRRLGRVEDVPPLVLLLASDHTSWVTGQVFSVNGGYSMV